MLRTELEEMRAQLSQTQQQTNGHCRASQVFDGHPPPMAVPPPHGPFAHPHYATSSEQPRTLPPLINGSSAPMQGIQFTDERR